MKKLVVLFIFLLILVSALFYQLITFNNLTQKEVLATKTEQAHWFILSRKSNIEKLYYGEAGNILESDLVKTFRVKSGVPGQKPTPLPKLLGRDYWLIVDKYETKDNPETAPYFLKLDIPVGEEEPFGPEPYLECEGQCNWQLPGAFGLHGVAGDESRLSDEILGSSGCIRHSDADITYLYNLLEPKQYQIRYYISDI
jgi:lipoprotein-anchoring transpeptidase ErfK/SrfK